MVFVKRKLDNNPPTLGQKLRALRRGQAVSLEMMSKKTQIRISYLQALESGRYDLLPPPLYVRNFIRAYTRALKADENYFIELYNDECGRCDLITPMQSPRQKLNKKNLFVWNRLLKISAFGGILAVILIYIGWQINFIISPPNVLLLSPAEETFTNEGTLYVEGVIDGDATVLVNGQPTVIGENNKFKTAVDLEKGLNIIEVEAKRRYSKKTVIQRRVVYQPESGISRVSFFE